MPSQSTGIYILLSGVLAAIISGIFSVWNNEKQRIWQLEREEQQHIRQLEQEEQQRIFQQKSEQQKWFREKIYDSYSKIIQFLTEMMQIEFEVKNNYMTTENQSIKAYRLSLELMSEFQRIVYGYPAEEFEEFEKKIDEFNKHLATNTIQAKGIIIEIMENDSRIKNINKYSNPK
jgi:hypothetical protein